MISVHTAGITFYLVRGKYTFIYLFIYLYSKDGPEGHLHCRSKHKAKSTCNMQSIKHKQMENQKKEPSITHKNYIKTDLNWNKRFLKTGTEAAETICSDKEFQMLTTRSEK